MWHKKVIHKVIFKFSLILIRSVPLFLPFWAIQKVQQQDKHKIKSSKDNHTTVYLHDHRLGLPNKGYLVGVNKFKKDLTSYLWSTYLPTQELISYLFTHRSPIYLPMGHLFT